MTIRRSYRFGVALAILSLLTPWVALGDQPRAVVVGPSRVLQGGAILLDARQSVCDAGQQLEWRLSANGSQFIDDTQAPFITFDKNGKKDIFLLMTPSDAGRYIFALMAVGKPADGPVTADIALHTIDVVPPTPPAPVPPPPGPIPGPPTPTPPTPGPAPTPTPPQPIPPPTPPPPTPGPVVPATTALHLTCVVDVNQMTPEVAAVTTSPILREKLKQLNTFWRRYDITSPVLQPPSGSNPKGVNLIGTVQAAGGPPVLVLQQDGVGRPLAAIKLPSTEAEVVALVQKYRGS